MIGAMSSQIFHYIIFRTQFTIRATLYIGKINVYGRKHIQSNSLPFILYNERPIQLHDSFPVLFTFNVEIVIHN